MPGFDGTGPRGQGPFSGGGRGYCAGVAGYARPGFFGGRSFRRGGPRGFGFRRAGYFAYRQDDVNMLKEEAAYLKEELNAIEERITQLEKSE